MHGVLEKGARKGSKDFSVMSNLVTGISADELSSGLEHRDKIRRSSELLDQNQHPRALLHGSVPVSEFLP